MLRNINLTISTEQNEVQHNGKSLRIFLCVRLTHTKTCLLGKLFRAFTLVLGKKLPNQGTFI